MTEIYQILNSVALILWAALKSERKAFLHVNSYFLHEPVKPVTVPHCQLRLYSAILELLLCEFM